jgi:ribosomal protein S18 acetylase RimI-like enzyme
MINSSYQAYLCQQHVFDRGMLDLAAARTAQLPETHLMLESHAGAVWLELLPWDSAILEVPCARVNALFSRAGRWTTADAMSLLEATQRECELRGVKFVSCRITARVVALSDAFSLAGWLLRDALTVHSVAPRARTEGERPDDLLELSASDLDGRFDAFATSFEHGRIHREPRISHDRAVVFYRQLFDSVIAADDAIRVGVRENGELVGFAIGGIDRLRQYLGTDVTYLWQIAVRPEYRGRGLSTTLVRGFLQRCDPDLPVEMDTAFDNPAAGTLGVRGRMRLVANAFTYHRWYSGE